MITDAIAADNTARKNKLNAPQVHSRKAIHYEVIKRSKNYVEQGGRTQSKVKDI